MNPDAGSGRPAFRFCVVAARAAFPSDGAWCAALEHAAGALARYPAEGFLVQVRPRVAEPRADRSRTEAVREAAIREETVREETVREETIREETVRAETALQRLRALAPGVKVLLNGPEPIAAALGYDGVHWREAAIPAVRPPRPWLRTASVHDVAALRRAEAAGAALVLFAPVWPPTWKPSRPAGLDGLRAVTAVARVPVLALGGVTPERVVECTGAGAAGVAVASGVVHPEAAEAVARFLRALAWPGQRGPIAGL